MDFKPLLIIAVVMLATGCAQVEQSSNLRLNEPGKLIVGMDISYEPLEYIDEQGNVVGLDVDVAREIASSMGLDIEFRHYEWDYLFDAIKRGEVDIAISGITITPERQEEMVFSAPYFSGGQVIVVPAHNQDITSVQDLADKIVSVSEGTTGEEVLLEYVNSSNVIISDSDNLLEDLSSRNVDATVEDYVVASSYVKTNPGLKIVGDPITQEYYGIATKKSNEALIEQINAVLRNMKRDGRLDTITNNWLR